MGLFFRSRTTESEMYHPQRFKTLESFNHDGFEVARRKPAPRGFPFRQVVYFVVAVVAFKVFLFFEMGAGAYGAKVQELQAGTTMEQIASVAMTLDPMSQWVVDVIRFGKW